MESTKKPRKRQSKVKPKTSPYTSDRFLCRFQEIVSILLVLIGSAIVFAGATSLLNLDWKHPFVDRPKEIYNSSTQPKPATIYIPKLRRALKISDGQVIDNRWTTSLTGISYLTTSAKPGDGNSVMYGHNLDNLLGDLYLVKEGDQIFVVLSSGSVIKYQVFQEKEVTPQSVEILDPSQDSRLTLYTCSGFLDSARFVVVAKQTNFI